MSWDYTMRPIHVVTVLTYQGRNVKNYSFFPCTLRIFAENYIPLDITIDMNRLTCILFLLTILSLKATAKADWWLEAEDPASTATTNDGVTTIIAPKGAVESPKKIANTKNNIIRLYLENTASNTQIYAKDAVDSWAAYIRERKQVENTDNFYYQNFADCGSAKHYDFELSDAITVFENYNTPITNKPEGVKTGMLSTLLLNGMNVGINHGKIWKLEIRKSMVSKYVTGYAIYMGHKLSSKYWRSVALPYNLSREQLKKAFGDDVVICELGKSAVTKEKTTEEGNLTHYHYGISFNFTKIPDTEEGINANYPYMIKLKNGVKENDSYPIENVKADVRDYQAYEFRTGKFDLSALDAKEPTAMFSPTSLAESRS